MDTNELAQLNIPFPENQVVDESLISLFDTIDSNAKGLPKSNLLDERKSVVLSNQFVIGIEEGSRLAYRISRIAIGQIPMNADKLPLVKITADDFEEMELTRQRLTGHANAVINEILSYRIKLASFDNIHFESKLMGINVFSVAYYLPGEAAIVVQLNPILKGHFLNLKKNYTQYQLAVVTKLSGFAASKLHEVLLSKSREYGVELLKFDIADLQKILNYRPKGNPKASEFVKTVIKRAVANINEKTECQVYYKAIRSGREFKYVRFYVSSHWKTYEEKASELQWQAERSEVDPSYKQMLTNARAEIERLLITGEGELSFGPFFS